MMGVTKLEVFYNIYNITEKNNKFTFSKQKKILKEHKVNTELISKMKYLYETSGNKGISKRDKIY